MNEDREDLTRAVKRLNRNFKGMEILADNKRTIISRTLPGTLSYHEAILLLESLKHSFPDEELEKLITEVEDMILLKAGVNMPIVKEVK